MLRSIVARWLAAAWLAAVLAPSAFAERQGETIQGELVHVELHDSPRHVVVRTGDGRDVRQVIANRTRIVFSSQYAGFFPDPGVSDLRPGMSVRFRYDDGVCDRIYVLEVPYDLRPHPRDPRRPEGERPDSHGQAQDLKVRILGIDRRHGELTVDVAGRSQRFRVAEKRLLRDVDRNDLVIVRVRGDLIEEIRSAAVSGRITSLDRRRGEIVVDSERYFVEDRHSLGNLDRGDRIRFEFEDRPDGRKVITRIF